ncbi:MAG: RNA polymerase sigma factor [Steroidobacteraceae bacterium]
MNAISRRFRPALMAFFVRRIHDHSEAEDLTQQVLMRVAERAASIDERGPDAYIFQIAANLLRDRSRRLKVRAAYQAGLGVLEASRIEELDPHRVVQGRHSLAVVLKALNELPERTRNIFILARLESITQREIADMLGLSVRTVEQHVIRATAHLRECLEAE